MPIRVSYTGSDGTKRSVVADNPFEAAERILKITGGNGGNAGLGGANGFGQNADSVKLSPGGSLKNTVRGIELDGDGRVPVGGGPMVYARKDGRRGWFSQDEIDTFAKGAVIGDPSSSDVDPQNDNRSENDNVPYSSSSVSRIVLEQRLVEEDGDGDEKSLKRIGVLWAFVREHSKTAGGREKAVSAERKVFVGNIPVEGGSGGGTVVGSFTKVGGVRFKNYEFQVRIDTVEVVDGEFVTTEGNWEKMEGGDTVAHSTTEY